MEDLSTWDKSLQKIAEHMEKQPRQSLKQRHLEILSSAVQRVVDESQKDWEDSERDVLQRTKSRWIEVGMIRSEDAHLVTSLKEPFHPTIESSRQEYFKRKRVEDGKRMEQKAAAYYQNEWVLERETELRELQRQENVCSDSEVKNALRYRIGVLVDALRGHYEKQDENGLKKYFLAERKKMATKWLSLRQLEQVESIWDPLPCDRRSEDDDDDEAVFPLPSQPTRRPSRKRAKKSATQVPKRGRIAHFFSQM